MRGLPSNDYFTTGQAAELCSVTPDTVLKWIRAGKLKANRTPGGHHRIPRSALLPLLKSDAGASLSKHKGAGSFQYCWEFNSKAGKITSDCRNCVVYRSGTLRCYEMIGLPVEAGHSRQFCQGSCDECEYYKMVHGHRPGVLVVTDKKRSRTAFERDAREVNFDLQITDCEYRCSMLVEKFRPDYVVIDCSIGSERSQEFANLLLEDPRIPLVRIILAGNRDEIPRECDKIVFAFIERPFTAHALADIIRREHT